MKNLLFSRFTVSFYGRVAMCGSLVLVGTSCRQAINDHGHDHGDEPKTAQISVWTDRYEVFAEHRAPVAGKATTFITHITDLNTLEPRREGPVKFLLRQGEIVVEHPQAAPARAGIYLPGIIFPGAGDWQVTVLIPTGTTNAPVELGQIKVYSDPHSADHAEIPDGPEGVSFLKEQQWKILSRTELVAKRSIAENVRVPALVRAKPGFNATVVAPVSGQLADPSPETFPQPGQHVKAGQLLASLKPNFSEAGAKVAEAQAEFITARAVLAQAEAAHARTQKLVAEEAKSPREMQEAELALQSAKARYGAAAGFWGTFRPLGEAASSNAPLVMELRAPIAGVIDGMAAGAGELVSANQPVFTVLNPELVWVEASLPEASGARLGGGKHASYEVPGQAGQFFPVTGEGHGRFVSLGLSVDAVTRTIPLIYETANPDGKLRVGQRLTLLVETARTEAAVCIPESALVEEGDQLIAFVQVSGETFEKREVRAGLRDGAFVQVLEGIHEGERVVTKGAYAIRLSSISGNIPAHGHAH